MKQTQILLLRWSLCLLGCMGYGQFSESALTKEFNQQWHFIRQDVPDAKNFRYDDRSWRTVNLPHDWSIEDVPDGKQTGPFSKSSIGKAATGWTVGGTGWYRKHFITNPQWAGKEVKIHFDGVYMNATFYVNGTYVDFHPYGYTPFYVDLTPYLNPPGEDNVLAVQVANEGKNSRWYSGSGIYRAIYMTVQDPLHIAPWGVAVTTPEVSEKKALLSIATQLINNRKSSVEFKVKTSIIAPDGKIIAPIETIAKLALGEEINIVQTQTVERPVLWSVDYPMCYRLITELESNGTIVDRYETKFGIRSIEFDAAAGFLLNGNPVLLKGGCIHHDNGALGSAAYEDAEYRKVLIMKNNGYNAIRSSHNPPSEALLNACDELGMLVIDEAFDTWIRPKNTDDYSLYFNQWWKQDLQAMILRDRNHPSIIMWSIGNEIYEAPDLLGQELAEKLASTVKALDPSRPVTEAMVYLPPYTKHQWEAYQPHVDALDVDGYNYFLAQNSIYFKRDSATHHRMDLEHQRNPDKVFYISESLPSEALTNWNIVSKVPYVIGNFKWTAFDYIGEAGLGQSRLHPQKRPIPEGVMGMGLFFKNDWPLFNSASGDFDLIGNKKAASYYQDVVWKRSPVEILVHRPIPKDKKEAVAPWGFPDELKSWNWENYKNEPLTIHVYSYGDKIELLLNGKIVGEKFIAENNRTASFEIPFQAGTLEAIAFKNGKVIGRDQLKTTGKPVAVVLQNQTEMLHLKSEELLFIEVSIVDPQGKVVPNQDELVITYEVDGPGELIAVGNGNGADMSSFQSETKKVYQGKGLLIIKLNGSKGKLRIRATAEGVAGDELKVMIQ